MVNQNEIYDYQTFEVLKLVLAPDSNCVDVGAHSGSILEWMITIAPKGRHYAFEPIPIYAAATKLRFPKAIVHQVALSNESGRSPFQYVTNDPAYSGLLHRTYDRDDPIFEELEVEVECLDNLIPVGEKIDAVKIDVEGAEYLVMEGAKETLSMYQPYIIFEAGYKSTAHYEITPQMIYDLITLDFQMNLSTMCRWLAHMKPFTAEEFLEVYDQGWDYYFLAYR